MNGEINIKKYKGIPFKADLNRYKIPVTILPLGDKGQDEFNEIYQTLLYLTEQGKAFPLTRTPSGGISIAFSNYYARPNEFPKWDLQSWSDGMELMYVDWDWNCRIQCRVQRYTPDNEPILTLKGRQCYWAYKAICKRFGIELDDYKRLDGKEIWKTIPKPLIKFDQEGYENVTFKHVHHLDLNAAYGVGVGKEFPEFQEVNLYLYNNRGEKPGYKDVLNKSIGFFASRHFGWKLAHLTKAAKIYTNNKVIEMSQRLLDAKRMPLLYNTDGIWYEGDIYTDAEIGLNYGQWKNDHVDCTFRAKSPGAYEYMENGKYYPVVRGKMELDKSLSRSLWKWGDIYKGPITTYVFLDKIGFVEKPITELEVFYGSGF